MSASRMPTRRCLRRSPTASSAVTSDLPTPPLPDMIGIDVRDLGAPAERARARAARGGGLRSLIGGTLPERRACVSAATIGSTRRPCAARALLDRFVLAHAAAAAAQAERAAAPRRRSGSCGDQLVDVRLRGDLDSIWGMRFSMRAFEACRTARGVCRPSSIERALGVLAGGCDSPVRSGWSVGGADVRAGSAQRRVRVRRSRPALHRLRHGLRPAALRAHASGADRPGSTRSPRAASSGARRTAKKFASPNAFAPHLPSMQRMRFVTTGTEAMMSAIRVARAFTGRVAILKFAGNYHGHFDLALLDAGASARHDGAARSGIPDGVTRDVAVARYNDLDSVDALLARPRRRARRDRRRADRRRTWASSRRSPGFSKACASARGVTARS